MFSGQQTFNQGGLLQVCGVSEPETEEDRLGRNAVYICVWFMWLVGAGVHELSTGSSWLSRNQTLSLAPRHHAP